MCHPTKHEGADTKRNARADTLTRTHPALTCAILLLSRVLVLDGATRGDGEGRCVCVLVRAKNRLQVGGRQSDAFTEIGSECCPTLVLTFPNRYIQNSRHIQLCAAGVVDASHPRTEMSELSFKVKLAIADSNVECYDLVEEKLLRALYSTVGDTFGRESNSTPQGVAALKRMHKSVKEEMEKGVKEREAVLDEQRRLCPPTVIPV